ncbi:MAG: hypothetical protein ACI4EF_12900 [Coprococcus sp.]
MYKCNVCGEVYEEKVERCEFCSAVMFPEEEKTKNMQQYAKVCPFSVKIFSILSDVVAWLLFVYIGILGVFVWINRNKFEDVNYWICFAFGLCVAILIIQIVRSGCFKTYAYSKKVYIICGIIAAIVLAEQVYVLVVSGWNFGLVRILYLDQWRFYSIVAFFMLYWLFFGLYRVQIGRSYRTYYMEQTGITKKEYDAIKRVIDGNQQQDVQVRGKNAMCVAVVLIFVCIGSLGLQIKKENDVYIEGFQSLTQQIEKELALANEEKDSFPYNKGKIEITEADFAVMDKMNMNIWRMRAACYNAIYGTDYDLNCLDEILCEYAQDMTADTELYKFGTFVLGDGYVISETNYDIFIRLYDWHNLKQFDEFVRNYYTYIDKNVAYQLWDELAPDKIQEIMKLYVSEEGDIMAKDLMCRQLLGLIDRECSYNTDGQAVLISDKHINRPYLYVTVAYMDKRNLLYLFDSVDLGVEQICGEYESFCQDGILKEDGILEDLYSDYGDWNSAATQAINQRTSYEIEEIYAFLGDYVDSHDGSIADMEQAESLSEEDYELLAEALEAYEEQLRTQEKTQTTTTGENGNDTLLTQEFVCNEFDIQESEFEGVDFSDFIEYYGLTYDNISNEDVSYLLNQYKENGGQVKFYDYKYMYNGKTDTKLTADNKDGVVTVLCAKKEGDLNSYWIYDFEQGIKIAGNGSESVINRDNIVATLTDEHKADVLRVFDEFDIYAWYERQEELTAGEWYISVEFSDGSIALISGSTSDKDFDFEGFLNKLQNVGEK